MQTMASTGVGPIFFLYQHLYSVGHSLDDWSRRGAALDVKFQCLKSERRQII